jgi:D-alanyl-D-alanine carboxypeptidase (penicillin-binding protein 5/6)
MNRRAAELGLRSTIFRSAHGLPVYTGGALPAKRQNEMSANDLFTLCKLLLDDYPRITGITGQRYVRLESLQYTTANSNPLVFNMEGVNGLKTGSTNRAGYCLAASLPVSVGEETHTLVLILLGAETAQLRGQAAELLLQAAKRRLEAGS